MSRRSKTWILVDVAMIAALPLLMAYALVGEFAHECIGAASGVLFVVHAWLNRRAVKSIARGRWNAVRILRMGVSLALAVALTMTMATGIATSHYLFAQLRPAGFSGAPLLEIAHMTAAHWAFVLAGMHLGLNWKRITAVMPHANDAPASDAAHTAARLFPTLVALLGCAAFIRRGIWRYLLGLNHFALIDFTEPALRCIAEYLLAGALFVVVGSVCDKAARVAAGRGNHQ